MFPARVLPILLAAVLIGAAPARAFLYIFNVDATTDEPDAVPGDGDCISAPSGDCTLRAAIQEANALDDIVMIILEDGEYTLSRNGAGEDAAATGDLDVLKPDTVVQGVRGGRTTVRTVLSDRIFDVRATGLLVLADLTVQEGLSDRGGGIRNLGDLILERVTVTQNLGHFGGGIYHDGESLVVNASTVSWNGGQFGGGIAAYGPTRIDGSTIHDNLASTGGGIFAGNEGEITLVNATVSGNRASRDGGGLSLAEPTIIRSSTIAGNSAAGRGGGIAARLADTPFELSSSIVAGNGAGTESPDCDGDVLLVAPNLVENLAGCTLSGDVALAITGVDAGLEPLAPGGLVATHALTSSSPGIDAGAAGGCNDETGVELLTDARGEPRDADGLCSGASRCDLGAFERAAVRDDDGDGAVDAGCPAGTDCDDADAAVRPGVLDVCNGVDDDCSGAPDDAIVCVPVPGTLLNLRDGDSPSLTFKGRQPGLVLPERGTAADPTCGSPAGGGALLEVFGLAGSGHSASVVLPCERWSAKERGGRVVAYAYADSSPGACRAVRVTGRGIVAKCGAGLDLTDAGERRVGLLLGTGGTTTASGMRQYCAELGGRVRRDDASRFVAAKAVAPGVCPTPPGP